MIGVVGDVLHEGLDGETKPEMYVPVEQAPNIESGPTIVVRTALDTGAAAAELRGAVAAIDRAMPVDRIETMEQLVSGSVAQPRFRTVILAAFSMLALVMASIGIYGVMNYLVIQRTREFGIRLSVGATRADVLRLVLGRAAVLIGAGTCLGLAGSVRSYDSSRSCCLERPPGSADVRGGAGSARSCGPGRELYSGVAGDAGRSRGGFAIRVTKPAAVRRLREPGALRASTSRGPCLALTLDCAGAGDRLPMDITKVT